MKVLFLCTGNSARSILAEYLLRAMDSRFTTASAGARPAGEVHPAAVRVLREAYGIDAAGARSESWEAYRDDGVDLLITVCDDARESCPLVDSGGMMVAHWGSEDPARATGTEDEVDAVFRRVAREIHGRLERLCALPWDALDRDALDRGALETRIRAIGERS